MKLDEFSAAKRSVAVGEARVVHYDEGAGDPLLLGVEEERPERLVELIDRFPGEALAERAS